MRFITVNIGCDWLDCDTVAPEDSGEVGEMTLAVDNKAARTVGICVKHREEFDDLVAPLLAKGITEKTAEKTRPSRAKTAPSASSTPAEETVPSSVDTSCRVCGQVTKGNVGLAQHLKKKHDGMTRAEHDLLPLSPEMT